MDIVRTAPPAGGARGGAGRRLRRLACLMVFASMACRDVNVVTESYATLAEATAAGAVNRGSLPRGLPQGTSEIREARDLDSSRRWGLFSFPVGEGDGLRSILGPDISLEGVRCDPPRRIEWWPVLLRGPLRDEQVRATGLNTYQSREEGLVFLVNWKQGRAYFCTRDGTVQ